MAKPGSAAFAAVAALIVLSGCAPRQPVTGVPAVVRDPGRELQQAASLYESGCLDCLVEAHQLYRALEQHPQLGGAARDGAFATALSIGLRRHELGLDDDGWIQFAGDRLTDSVDGSGARRPLLDIVETLPRQSGLVASEADFQRRAAALRRRDEFQAFLQPRADEGPVFADVYLAFACANRTAADDPALWLDRMPRWRDTGLIRYRAATCRGIDEPAIRQLLAANPRFVELRYFLGVALTLSGGAEAVVAEWRRAHEWQPRWPLLTQALAEQYVILEEHQPALEFYDKTLQLSPALPSALLGRAKVLTYLERYQESLVVIDELLALDGWYVGDARYWRALNLTQLERYDAAWEEVERAAALVANADVPKLAGIIAYRRGQREVARGKFEAAWRRNPADCEIGLHLSIALSDLRVWSDALAALTRTVGCLDSDTARVTKEVIELRASPETAPRQAKRLADREDQLVRNQRLQKTVWFNAAVASYYSARMDEAREFAMRVLDDEEFGGRARALLARIP